MMTLSGHFPTSGYGGRAGPFCLAALVLVLLLAADPVFGKRPNMHSPVVLGRELEVDATSRDSRIVGGEPIDISCAPYQVELLLSKDGATYLCGGVIIDLQYVVTARHCILTSSNTVMAASGVTVYAGSNTARFDSLATKRNVSKIWSHPSSSNDVALLKLSTLLPVSSKITPIKLSFSDSLLVSGSDIAISGWGLLRTGGSLPSALQGTTLDFLPNGCSVYGSYFQPASQICAGCAGRNVSSCQGDSGGPAVTSSSSGGCPVLLGMTSYGSAEYCARYPAVWARASAVVDWLELQAGRVFRSQYNLQPTASCETCTGQCRAAPCRTCASGCRMPAFNATRCRVEAMFSYGFLLTIQPCTSTGGLPIVVTLESSPYLTSGDVNGQVWLVQGTYRAWSTITLGGVLVRVPVSNTASMAYAPTSRVAGWSWGTTLPATGNHCGTVKFWYAAVFVSYDGKTVQVTAPKQRP